MKILINSHPSQTRLAQIEGQKAVSLHFFNKHKSNQVGSVYKGRVIKVLPSLEACFVDLGGGQEAFLHQKELGLLKGVENLKTSFSIQNKIKAGQMILVQIAKSATALKRARLTAVISFAGRSLVYLPQSSGIGVSRRIEEPKERERLLNKVKELEPEGGVIIRTQAEGKKDFSKDLKELYSTWSSVQKKSRKTPGLIYSELTPELQILRDELSSRHSQVLIDDLEVYKSALQYVKKAMPQLSSKLVYYGEPEPLFEKFGMESQWMEALSRQVRLKSGGSIVIDENEAMVSIDVNTGRAGRGKNSHQETVFKTNMEAVKEIASQIRLRNCGGIIVIDLIDMESNSLKEKVMNSFQNELKKDPVYTEVVSLSSLNLIEMTRKRTKPSLKNTLCEECPSCRGRGAVLSPHTLSCSIFRAVEDKALDASLLNDEKKNTKSFTAVCSPPAAEWILENEEKSLEFLKLKKNIILSVQADSSLKAEDFYIK